MTGDWELFMRFLRPTGEPLVHIVDHEYDTSLCGLGNDTMWVYPQTPFGLEYMCDACKAEWVLLQLTGRTVTLYNWYDATANRAYLAREGFDGLLYRTGTPGTD